MSGAPISRKTRLVQIGTYVVFPLMPSFIPNRRFRLGCHTYGTSKDGSGPHRKLAAEKATSSAEKGGNC